VRCKRSSQSSNHVLLLKFSPRA